MQSDNTVARLLITSKKLNNINFNVSDNFYADLELIKFSRIIKNMRLKQ